MKQNAYYAGIMLDALAIHYAKNYAGIMYRTLAQNDASRLCIKPYPNGLLSNRFPKYLRVTT